MKIKDKFGIYGIDDERQRRTLFPARIVLTRGNVRGERYLTEYKPAQVALYSYHNQCVLDNRGSDTNAAVLVDFGRELHGSLNVSVWNMDKESCSYVVRLGESVSEALTPIGIKNATNNHALRDTVTETGPWSSNETAESGFRFAYIELTTPDAFMELRAITATLIFRDIEYRGCFECSDPILTKCYDTAAYTVHLNMQRYLWDGIKRDRLVWAGDMNTEIATILAVFGENPVVPKSLDFVRDVTSTDESMNGISSYNLWWLICHYDWYIGTGNLAYLAEQKEYINELLLRYCTYVDESGREILPEGRFFDWPTNDIEEAKHAGLQGLLRLALLRGGEIMRILGEAETAAVCFHAAERMLQHAPCCAGNKQAAAMLALSGIADPKQIFDNVISVGGAAGLSTFLGYFTLNAARMAGGHEFSLGLIRDYWGKMLELGATTFWEDFDISWAENSSPITDVVTDGMRDIHGDFGAYCYTGLRHSLCHGWASGPAPYLASSVLGISPLSAGYKTVKFDPNLAGLEWARGKYPTPYGDIEVEVTKTSASIKAPDGVTVIK